MGNFYTTTEKLHFQPRQFCEPKEISTHKQNKIKNEKDSLKLTASIILQGIQFFILFTRVQFGTC